MYISRSQQSPTHPGTRNTGEYTYVCMYTTKLCVLCNIDGVTKTSPKLLISSLFLLLFSFMFIVMSPVGCLMMVVVIVAALPR